jgi:hypothetical protein
MTDIATLKMHAYKSQMHVYLVFLVMKNVQKFQNLRFLTYTSYLIIVYESMWLALQSCYL